MEMKIVQSFWSKPSLKKKVNNSDRSMGGWPDKKYNYFSWAFSCLQFKAHYKEVELVTDKKGYDLLINKLELPYTSIKVILDDLNEYNEDLWALGKIYTYSIQSQPFIHADSDVYIWERFDPAFERSSLLAQNIEKGFSYYDDVLSKIYNSFEFIPNALKSFKERNKVTMAINAGIIGGEDIDFFNQYAKEAFEFVDKSYMHLQDINVGMFNLIYEQFLFYAMAEECGKIVQCLLTEINDTFDGLADLASAPHHTKYIHAVGGYKRNQFVMDLLSYHLQKYYPQYYFRILRLLHTYQI